METHPPAIQEFCDAISRIRSSQDVKLSILQKATACMDVINSLPGVKQPVISHPVSSHSHRDFSQLLQCVPSTLLDLISGTHSIFLICIVAHKLASPMWMVMYRLTTCSYAD